MVKKSKEKKSKKSKDKSIKTFSPIDYFSDHLDTLEKEFQLETGNTNNVKLSTGSLVLDILTMGGYPATMCTVSGPEASAKSTSCWHTLAESLDWNIPIKIFFNAENALDEGYASRLLRVKTKNEVFGLRNTDSKKSGWLIKPKIRYYTTNILETVFKMIIKNLNSLPDKVYREGEGWYLVFDRDKKSRNLMKELQTKGLSKHDKDLYTKTGRYFCSVGEDNNFQALFVIDSYPTLVLQKIDDEESEGNEMAVDARAFSKYLKRIVGKLQSKKAILLGVNQIRLNPGQRFGNPEYEPGGKALEFYSAIRTQLRARANPPSGWKAFEKSVIDSKKKDEYDYKIAKLRKNKFGTCPIEDELWLRVWKSDHEKKGHGIDPVFDTFQYLVVTGQIKRLTKKDQKGKNKKKNGFLIKIKKLEEIVFDLELFKTMILAYYFSSVDLKKKYLKDSGAKKLYNLREICREQIQSNKYINMIINNTEKEDYDSEYDDLDLKDDVEE